MEYINTKEKEGKGSVVVDEDFLPGFVQQEESLNRRKSLMYDTIVNTLKDTKSLSGKLSRKKSVKEILETVVHKLSGRDSNFFSIDESQKMRKSNIVDEIGLTRKKEEKNVSGWKKALGKRFIGLYISLFALFFFITLCIMVISFIVVMYMERKRIVVVGKTMELQIQDSFSGAISKLRILRSYFTSESIDKKNIKFEEFSTFLQNSEVEYIGIQALEWIPRIKNEEREDFIDKIRNCTIHCDSFSNYEITKKVDGVMIPQTTQTEYFPVYFVQPVEGNEAAIGFDLASSSVRRESLIQSRDSALPIATSKIKLVQEEQQQNGFLIFYPVYSINVNLLDFSVNNSDILRSSLEGFVLGVFRVSDIVVESFQNQHDELDANIFVVDQNDDILYSSFEIQEEKYEENRFRQYNDKKKHVAEISIADRNWTLIFTPSSSFTTDRHSKLLYIWLFSIIPLFCFIVLIGIITVIIKLRKEEIKNFKLRMLENLQMQSTLLEKILPKAVIDSMVSGRLNIIDLRKNTAIFFFDIVSFTSYCNGAKIIDILHFLNNLFSAIDKTVLNPRYSRVTKLKTIGDGYMSAIGLFTDNYSILENTTTLLEWSLEVKKKTDPILSTIDRTSRCGCHCGVLICGVLGIDKPMLDVWGESVNLASRVEEEGDDGEINVTVDVYNLCKEFFKFQPKSEPVDLKGYGMTQIYLLKEQMRRHII